MYAWPESSRFVALQSCNCGHEKRDHNILTFTNYGSCKICLCNSYQAAVEAKAITPLPAPGDLKQE